MLILRSLGNILLPYFLATVSLPKTLPLLSPLPGLKDLKLAFYDLFQFLTYVNKEISSTLLIKAVKNFDIIFLPISH